MLADLEEIHAQWLPEHPGHEVVRDPLADARLRDAILWRAEKHGAYFSAEAAGASSHRARRRMQPSRHRTWFIAAAAAVVVCAASVMFVQQNFTDGAFSRIGPPPAPKVASESVPLQFAKTAVQRMLDARQMELTLRQQLKESGATQAALQLQIDRQTAELAGLHQQGTESARTIADLRQQLDASRSSQARAETELAAVRLKQSTSDAITIAEQQEIQTLQQKLLDQSASLDRERQLLSAGREIRDLIAARNLHIIDVYDTNSKGKTSHAFGRVFYTEGRSLVFYAYDLGANEADSGKYAFYLWGKRDGAPKSVKSLGALSKDGGTQQRWVLTITNPKVLAEIDSVFVTLEPSGKRMHHPSGKRILNAFLGTPVNHP